MMKQIREEQSLYTTCVQTQHEIMFFDKVDSVKKKNTVITLADVCM